MNPALIGCGVAGKWKAQVRSQVSNSQLRVSWRIMRRSLIQSLVWLKIGGPHKQDHTPILRPAFCSLVGRNGITFPPT